MVGLGVLAIVATMISVFDISSGELGNSAKATGVKAATCKELEVSTTGADDGDFRVVVVVIEGDHTVTRLLDSSLALDDERGSMS